jgi:hypothetical protein
LKRPGFESVFFFVTLVFSFPLKAEPACLTPKQIQASIHQFQEEAAPLIRSIPWPVHFKYIEMNKFIGGQIYLSPDFKIEISVTGTHCGADFGSDEMGLMLCHELGHVAGGMPFVDNFIGARLNIPMSGEGQADLFAASACLPALFAHQDNRSYRRWAKIYPELSNLCSSGDAEIRGRCARERVTALRFLTHIHVAEKVETTVSYPPRTSGPWPDLEETSLVKAHRTLLREYPQTQCRLDTFLSGFGCQALRPMENFTRNPWAGLSCGAIAAQMPRPACWYKEIEGSESDL